jgi:hypothetical protein
VKVLLLTDVPPCTEFSGALLTLHLCRLLPKESLACACVVSPAIAHMPKDPGLGVPMLHLVKPQEQGDRLNEKRFADLKCFLRELRTAWRDVPRLARRIVDFGRREQVDRVWCILQGQTMIRLALPVARGLGVPLLSQVWDHPSWWLDAHGVDPLTSRFVGRLYKQVLRRSRRIGAASFVMAREYRQAHGVAGVPLMGSIDAGAIRAPAATAGGFLTNPETVLIGLAGQIYSRREWHPARGCSTASR